MRKYLLAAVAVAMSLGLSLAAPVGVVKYDEKTKELTVKEGKKGEEKEKTIKLTDKAKFVGEDGKDLSWEDGAKKLAGAKKVDLSGEGDAVTIKFGGKKKADK